MVWHGGVVRQKKKQLIKINGSSAWPLRMYLDASNSKYVIQLTHLKTLLALKYDEIQYDKYIQEDIMQRFTQRHRESLVRVGVSSAFTGGGKHVSCAHCSADVATSKYRSHLANHLLLVAGLDTVGIVSPLSTVYCGYCGNEQTDMCRPSLICTKKRDPVDSDLTLVYGLPAFKKTYTFNIHSQCPVSKLKSTKTGYAAMIKHTGVNPCTNAPMKCFADDCSSTVWKYSLAAHFASTHPTSAVTPVLRETMNTVLTYSSYVITTEQLDTCMGALVSKLGRSHNVCALFRRLLEEKVVLNNLNRK